MGRHGAVYSAGLIKGRPIMARKTVGSALPSSTGYRKLDIQKLGLLVFGIRAVGHILVCGLR